MINHAKFMTIVDMCAIIFVYFNWNNCHELCMINHLGELKNLSLDVLQLYLPGEEEARVRRLTDMYKKALFNDEKIDETMISPDYTHGHFYRGVI
ncbi:MAG TPA: hypothetical protein GX534_05335 [Thermoanaerobacterales bacterium]|nr:hypothetical protein [Thermoanaerobacterales bacterium]